MVTPNPEAEYEPSDADITRALDWDEDDGEDEVAPTPVATTDPTPQPAPAQEPVAAPSVTPTQPVTPPTPPPDPFAQARELENQQLRQQAARNQVNTEASNYYNGLLRQGWGQDEAYVAAQNHAQALWSNRQADEATALANEKARESMAYTLSQQYGAPVEQLKSYDSPEAMQNFAKMWQATQGEIQELRKQITNPAPTQSFDSNRMTSSNSTSAMKLRAASDPDFVPTEEQWARILGQ